MALIDTEEAAKRLARVILSDIELYFRERPRVGETLDGQVTEGRRLFTSRVTPALVPLFDTVLADRRASTNREKTPAPSGLGGPEVAASGAESSWMQPATPGPVLVAQLLDGQATPMPLAEIQALTELPAAAVPLAPSSAPVEPAPPAPIEAAAPSPPASDATTSTPAPVAVAAPVSVPTAVPADVAAFAAASASIPAPIRAVPPAPPVELPVPRLTPRISVPRLLVLLAIVAAALALVARALS